MPEIFLKNVSKHFGRVVAVDRLDLQILSNAFVTLLGPSGCGKTTILRMIAGLETPTEGRITIGNKVVFDSDHGINLPPNKRDVGFLFQNYALWPHMTVYQNIAFGLENLKWSKNDIRSRIEELLAMLRIDQFENRYPSELSGGQQQRVAMTLSTMVCIIEKGQLQQYAPPLPMYNNPANLFVADFLGNPAMNFIDGHLTGDGVLSFAGLQARFSAFNAVTLGERDVTVGIRPEYVRIEKDGALEATVYSTLPSGMETTVKLEVNGVSLTSVVFGDVDFQVDRKVRFSFNKATVLFDRESGRTIARGALTLL